MSSDEAAQPGNAASVSGWSVATHDTIPTVEMWLNPLETHTYLSAFLNAEGTPFNPPYSGVREAVAARVQEVAERERHGQAPRDDVADQRLRTWKSVFESFGFLTVGAESGQIELSALGRTVKDLYETLDKKLEGANDQLARLAVNVLVRHRLRNPLDGTAYPEDSDLHPYRLVWKAMRELDDRLHWEEMNRVLMKVMYERDVPEAIERLQAARRGAAGRWDAAWLAALGEPVVDDGAETRRRITPWFTQAGFGGLLLSTQDDGAGFRSLLPDHKPLIDAALERVIEVPPEALLSRQAYLEYLSEDVKVSTGTTSATTDSDVDRVLEAVRRYGDRKIIVLSGIPGTGKTHIARIAAARLVDDDPYRFIEIQFHESTGYEDFVEGFVPRPNGEGHELRPKAFRVINRRAALDPKDRTYVLLIEELTRTNVHAVLGELITYVEHRDREFTLALSQQQESVSPRLVFLATMNPQDKSALTLDHALLRRLHRVTLLPSGDKLRDILSGHLDGVILDRLVKWFEAYEDVLPFGHAEFAEVRSEADLRAVWEGTLRYFLTDAMDNVRSTYVELEQNYPWR